jgi:hypothetical protein
LFVVGSLSEGWTLDDEMTEVKPLFSGNNAEVVLLNVWSPREEPGVNDTADMSFSVMERVFEIGNTSVPMLLETKLST